MDAMSRIEELALAYDPALGLDLPEEVLVYGAEGEDLEEDDVGPAQTSSSLVSEDDDCEVDDPYEDGEGGQWFDWDDPGWAKELLTDREWGRSMFGCPLGAKFHNRPTARAVANQLYQETRADAYSVRDKAPRRGGVGRAQRV